MVVFSGGLAQADSGTIGGGTALTVTLTSPVEGASYVAGNAIAVSGAVEVGEGAAVKDTDLAFVLDTSGSTGNASGLGCGSILACEKEAVLGVIGGVSSVRSPIANVGVVAFPSTVTVPLAPPAPVDLSGYTASGGTQFDLGITRARDMLAATTRKDLMVLFSDGDGTYAPVSGIGGMVIKAFTIAGAGCTGALVTAVQAGAPGSSCTVVSSLAALPAVVSDTIGSTLDGVDITVGGTVVQSLPVTAQGPGSATFSTSLTGLLAGNDQTICAVARATDAGGSGTVSDCSTVDILPAGTVLVDCSGSTTCTGSAADPGKSTLAFSAPAEFNETVTIAPDSGGATSCGGTACKTGYSVGFPTTSGTGPVASISVITANKVSLKDRLNAAVYIDGTRITAQCNNRVLIAKLRNVFGIPEPIPCITITYQRDGRLEYFVKFNADPVFRFR